MDDSENSEIEAARAEFESLGDKRVRDKVTRSRHTTGQWNGFKIELAERWLQEREDSRTQEEKTDAKAERRLERRAIHASTGAAWLSAVAAIATLYFLFATLDEDRASKRPYFTIRAEIPGNDIYIYFENIGTYPAKDLSMKIAFVDTSLVGEPEVQTRDFGNELPAGVEANFTVPHHWGTEKYMIVQLTYLDPVRGNRLIQDPVVFIEEGQINMQVSRQEKQTVLSHPSVRRLLGASR